MTIYAQGDILLIRVKTLPAAVPAVPPTTDGRLILAYGEATGHHHAVLERDATLYRSTADAVEAWLRVQAGGAVLTHDEHAPITLPAGTYRVVRQREYVPGPVRSRQVVD